MKMMKMIVIKAQKVQKTKNGHKWEEIDNQTTNTNGDKEEVN